MTREPVGITSTVLGDGAGGFGSGEKPENFSFLHPANNIKRLRPKAY
jgi:hypothetical protein